MSEKLSPFEMASVLSEKKGRPDVEMTGYNAFMVNRVMSNTKDSVLFANELNQFWNIPEQWQADFYYHGLDKRKRFGKWNKKDIHEHLEIIQEYTGYTKAKAMEVLDLLIPHLDSIKEALEKGGSSGRKRTAKVSGDPDRD